MAESAGRSASRLDRKVYSDRTASLSDLDLRLLQIVSEQRVVTQTQLENLLADVPTRTLRYRTARLHRFGLVGRTRPYRERGSAPFHLWPTRRGDALARGSPPPRGGERSEPNPTFLAHASALTGFYVALAAKLPSGVVLVSFAREADAREPYRALDGRRRAIAPDARAELEDDDGRRLVGLLEVDLGTMSHRRLRAKARGYADYAHASAWRERHDFCPALLFATVAEPRAAAFLDLLTDELKEYATLFACACGLVREPGRAVVEPVWQTAGDGRPLDLVVALREARRPYDEEHARLEEVRRREREERERLLRDSVALRDYLHRQRLSTPELLGDPTRTAIEFLLEGEGEPAEPERRALSALGQMLADPLVGRWAERDPDPREREALAGLVEHCRSQQLRQVTTLADRLGEGPALRRARRRLEAGGLLSAVDLGWLPHDAERDREARTNQESLRAAYLERREEEARRLAKAQGLTGRLRRGSDDFLEEVDRRLLRFCPRCEEIAYPGGDAGMAWSKPGDPAGLCRFCGQGDLEPFEVRE
jgi:hypothetical protein